MNNDDVLRMAMKQSAEDIGCLPSDFISKSNVIVPFKLGPHAKKYYAEPIGCNFISYGNNIVVGTCKEIYGVVDNYISSYDFYHCFETPYISKLNNQLSKYGQTIWLQAEYYLPDLNNLPLYTCDYEIRIMEKSEFENYYTPTWMNAICQDRSQLNNLCVGAFDKGQLIGLAGCTEDSEDMWQVGIDVLPEYRRSGIAAALTTKLTTEILEREKVPFLNTAWSNIRSARSAIKCGYVPSWVEMTIKPRDIINNIHKYL